MERISCRSKVFVTTLFAVSLSTGCGRSELLGGPDEEPVTSGGATSTVNSSAGGYSGVASSSLGGASGGSSSSIGGSSPFAGSGGSGGKGGWSTLSSSSTKPIAGAIGGSSGGFSSLAGSKASGGAGASGGSSVVGGTSALAGTKASGGAGASGGSSVVGGASALAGTKASGGSIATGGSTVRCSDAKACGGDVVGTWNVTASCLSATGQVDLSMLGVTCKSVTIEESLNVTGTWVAMSDGMYSDRTTTNGSVQFTLPASCLRVSGTTIGCSNVSVVFVALGYDSMACKDTTGGGCICATAVSQVGGLGVISSGALTKGSYKTSGNVLTLDGTNRYAYCASGTQLILSPQGTNPPATGSIIFQKQ